MMTVLLSIRYSIQYICFDLFISFMLIANKIIEKQKERKWQIFHSGTNWLVICWNPICPDSFLLLQIIKTNKQTNKRRWNCVHVVWAFHAVNRCVSLPFWQQWCGVWKIAMFHSFKTLALLSGIIESTVCWASSKHFDNCSLTATSKLTGRHIYQRSVYTEVVFPVLLVKSSNRQ